MKRKEIINEEEDRKQRKTQPKLLPNEPFVVHFLLDGFCDDVASDASTAMHNFIIMCGLLPTNVNRTKFINELRAGETEIGEYWDHFEEQKFNKHWNHSDTDGQQQNNEHWKHSDTDEKKNKIDQMITQLSDLKYDMILCGGSDNHAVGFRFLVHQQMIVFTNTGHGIDKYQNIHPRQDDMYRLYCVWKFKRSTDFQFYAKKIRGAIGSFAMEHIEDVYAYQVNIIPTRFEVKLLFDDDQMFSLDDKVQSFYIMHPDNWKIKDGILYAKEQISGSCTFHSIFWLLLLDVCVEQGVSQAIRFEISSRYTVLEQMLQIPLLPNKRISEQISCLQLIVRLYKNFKGRQQALADLLLEHPATIDYIKRQDLPTEDFDTFDLRVDRFRLLLNTILSGKYLDDIIESLHNLLIFLNDAIKAAELADFISDEELPKCTYLVHCALFISTSMRHAERLPVKTASLDLLESFTRFAYLYHQSMHLPVITRSFKAVVGYRVDWTQLSIFAEHAGSLITFIRTIHNSLPNSDQLTIHPVPFLEIDSVLANNTSCDNAIFVRNFANYMHYENSKINNQSAIWRINTRETTVSRQPIVYQRQEHESVYTKSFLNFIKSSVVNECIAGIFNIICNPTVAGQFFKLPMPVQINKAVNSKLNTSALEVIADLGRTVPLSLLDWSKSPILPGHERLSHTCYDKLQEETQILLSDSNVAYSIPDDFHQLRLTWLRESWLRAAPQFREASNDTISYIAVWLFYLWPVGPPDTIATGLTGVYNEEIPMISEMLLVWRTRGAEGSIKKIITLQQQQDPHDTQSVRLLVVELFANALFYLPEQASAVLVESKIDSHHGRNIVLRRRQHWPIELRYLHWPANGKTVTHQEDSKFLIYPEINEDSYWYQIWRTCQTTIKMPCTMWAHGNVDGPVTVRLHFKRTIVILDCTTHTLTTPGGDVYEIVMKKYPPCMRQWVQGHEACLALPLRKEKQWFLFLCGQSDLPIKQSVFGGETNYQEEVAEPIWYIYRMHTGGSFMPILNRYTPGWYFLLQHLVHSVKQSCLELIRPSIVYITKDIDHEEKNQFPLLAINWPSAHSHLSDPKRRVYMEYLKFAILQDITSTELEDKLWRILSTSVTALPVFEITELLHTIVYDRLSIPYTPYPADILIHTRQLFEIASGKIMTDEQVPLLKKMIKDVDNVSPSVRLALMGIGKSSVLVPSLAIHFIRDDASVTIIQPSHLVPQTLAVLDEILPLLFHSPSKFRVMSDTQAKKEYMSARYTGSTFDNSHIVIFDEIDSMYNCFRSEYNQPIGTPITHNITSLPMDRYYQLIVQLVYNKGMSTTEQTVYWGAHHSRFWQKIQADVALVKRSMKFRLTFGCVPGNLLAIPFSAVNKPVVGSNFTDIDITAILTCLVRRKIGLSREDFQFLKHQLHQLHQLFGLTDFLPTEVSTDLFSLQLDEIVKKYQKDKELAQFYLSYILLPNKLRTHSKQFNLSFIDLMDSNFAMKRIGFSGTKLMLIPQFKDGNWGPEIVPDKAAELSIQQNILRGDEIIQYNIDSLRSQLSKHIFDVLIDAGALLRKYDAIEVVKEWAQLENNKSYVYVYIDSLHQAREYTLHDSEQPVYRFNAKKTYRWYFDQQHTVGIDLPVKETAVGLTLVNDKSRLTDVAQAIYRLRQLGDKKQVIRLFMMKGKSSKTRAELYTLLQSNDDKFLSDIKGRHCLQNAKAVFRSENKNGRRCYEETVKYYLNEIEYPNCQNALCTRLVEQAKQCLRSAVNEVDLQHEQEQEQEQEQSTTFNTTQPVCFDTPVATPTYLYNYTDELWGTPIQEIRQLSLSPTVSSGLPDQLDALCVIYKESPRHHCKIITIAEMLLIHSRGGLPSGFSFRYRLQKDVAIEEYGLLLALALCGRPLALHEQLVVIKNVADKEILLKLTSCFKVTNSAIFNDYFNSNFNNAEYIKSFTTDFETFLRNWVRIPIPREKLLPYFQICLRISKPQITELITSMFTKKWK
jgi:hypothetical protein